VLTHPDRIKDSVKRSAVDKYSELHPDLDIQDDLDIPSEEQAAFKATIETDYKQELQRKKSEILDLLSRRVAKEGGTWGIDADIDCFFVSGRYARGKSFSS
jgi:hypothetical protein